MADERPDPNPDDRRVTEEIHGVPPAAATVPDDAPAATTVSASAGVGPARRRDRWRRAVPTSRRGRGLLAALAALALLLVGGVAGFAIGHADGDRGDQGGFAVQDGGPRGDGDGDGGPRGDRGGDRGGAGGGQDDGGSTSTPSTSAPATSSPAATSSAGI